MKLFIKFLICIALGALVMAVAGHFSSNSERLSRRLESVSLPKVRLENATLKEVATIMETNLVKQGVQCKVVVDSAIADESVHWFIVGAGTGRGWVYAVSDVFQCKYMLCDDGVVLFLRK
jgi:hypothetical protein